MLVSIVIPNYNYAAYPGRSIESVVEQTYRDIELPIIDDDSSDNSKQVILSGYWPIAADKEK